MAKVQLELEKRLPALRDLSERGVFSLEEIAEIVRRLTKYESGLIRQGTTPKDIIDYADYEQNLDKLRRLRTKRLKLKSVSRSISEHALHRHILSLYARGVRRFAHSRALWHHYIAFTLTGVSAKATSNALTGAVAAMPDSAEFWILAARWEADGNGRKGGGNFEGARKLLMRGLRFNRADPALWHEWVRLELGFAERMRARWKTLGLLKDTSVANRPDETVRMDVLDAETDEGDGIAALGEELELKADPPREDESGRQALVNGALVRLVMKNAFEACADDALFSSVLETLHELPHSSTLRRPIFKEVIAHMEAIPNASTAIHLLLATLPYYRSNAYDTPADLVESLASSVEGLDRMTSQSPMDSDLREGAMRFLVDRHGTCQQPALTAFLAGHIARHWRTALKRGVATSTMARLYLDRLKSGELSVEDEAVRCQLLEFLGQRDAEGGGRPSLAQVEQRSRRPSASVDDHLALLAELARTGKGAQVPIQLRRIQGRLNATDARSLEERWATEAL